MLVTLGGAGALLVGPAALVALAGGGVAVWLSGLVAPRFAGAVTSQRFHGGPSGEMPSPLLALEWTSPRAVAQALERLDDETIAQVLLRLHEPFARRTLAKMPWKRQARVAHWLGCRQAFPRSAQARLARQLRVELGLSEPL